MPGLILPDLNEGTNSVPILASLLANDIHFLPDDEINKKDRMKISDYLWLLLCYHFDSVQKVKSIDTIREKILRIKQIVNDGMLKSYALPKDTEEGIVAFIDEYKRQLREISLRTVLKNADLAKSFPDNWQEMAKQTVLKPV